MVTIEEVQTAYYMVAATGVLVAAGYYILNLRVSQKKQEIGMKNQELMLKAQQQTLETRQIQIFTQFYDRFYTNIDTFFELLNDWNWKDISDFWQKYGPENNPEEWNKLRRVFSSWEQIGLLVHEGVIDPKLIYFWAGQHPATLFEKFYPVVIGFRDRYEKEPKGMQWEFFEDLSYILRDLHGRDVVDFSARLARRKQQREALMMN